MTARHEPILRAEDITVKLKSGRDWIEIVEGVSFSVEAGSCLAVVGESGSGKSMTFLGMLGLTGQIAQVTGTAIAAGHDLLVSDERVRRQIRGEVVSIVFQDPLSSLNPVRTIGAQVQEILRLRRKMSKQDARNVAIELLTSVELADAETLLDRYPTQLSGGMRQRVLIAMALACEPEVLIADECTTALDVTTQKQIIDLINRLRRERNLAVVWITHDLGVVSQVADDVLVLYSGQVLERGSVEDVLGRPRHPYTQALLACHPELQPFDSIESLAFIPGQPPHPTRRPQGCVFWARCHVRSDPRCEHERPPLEEVEPGHFVATFCHSGPSASPSQMSPTLVIGDRQ